MPWWGYLIIGIVAFILLGYFLPMFLISNMVTNKFSKPKYKEKTPIDCSPLARKETIFKMPDGYEIHGDISLNDPHKFVICCHGHGSNSNRAVKYGKMYYSLGYSVVLYDARSHGDNKRSYVTMGYREAKDLNNIINIIKELYGQDAEISLHGVSMGAVTALLCTQYRQDIQWIVADCPFCSLDDFIKTVIKAHQPVWTIYWMIRLVNKSKFHYDIKDVSVMDVVKNNDVPVLFIHGEKDDFILPYNQEKIANNQKGYKKVVQFPNAGHGQCFDTDPVLYKEKVSNFIKELE